MRMDESSRALSSTHADGYFTKGPRPRRGREDEGWTTVVDELTRRRVHIDARVHVEGQARKRGATKEHVVCVHVRLSE
jgi:hypothetical protein